MVQEDLFFATFFSHLLLLYLFLRKNWNDSILLLRIEDDGDSPTPGKALTDVGILFQ